MKKIYCLDCEYCKFGTKSARGSIEPPREFLQDTNLRFERGAIHTYYCTDQHKILVDSPLTKIDETENCLVKNKNNDCEYFKRKKITEVQNG